MKLTESRFDPSFLTPEQIAKLVAVISEEQRPALMGREGVRIELPDPIFHLLVRTVRMMEQGKAIVLLPEDETFTTQAAADYLGMSRQFLVDLLDSGVIPHHRVGSHRRVAFKDLREYEMKRDAERRAGLGGLFRQVKEAGLYDATYQGNAG